MKKSKTYTLAFWNLENFFDFENNPLTNDDDFLPSAQRKWSKKRYDRKLYKISSAIKKIGMAETGAAPSIIGFAEVENKVVLRDLINSKELKNLDYDFVHYDSYDERGIDVALIYNKNDFKVKSSEIFPVILEDENKVRDFTRDVLLVNGNLDGEEIHIIINHWPSRREGEELSSIKRMKASGVNSFVIQKLRLIHHNPKIIVMGDFNDNPDNDSVMQLIQNSNLHNVMSTIWSKERGSLNHDFNWNFFDQILISRNLIEGENDGLRLINSEVFDQKFLTQYRGRFQGQPYRTYVGTKYKGGYSDHFPVYIQLMK